MHAFWLTLEGYTAHMRSLSLALGGGGVRGAAHIGVLRALCEADLAPTAIAGTSSGAIVAMLYALETAERFGADTYRHIERIGAQGYAELRFLFHPQTARAVSLSDRLKVLAGWERVIRGGVFGAGMVSQEVLRSNLIAMVGGARFEDARLPLAFIAVDLLNGEKVALKSGSMLEAALASSAIPGVFPPVAIGGQLLSDGHIVDNIPVDDARALVSNAFVLAVDIGDHSPVSLPKTALEVILRSAAISRDHLRRASLSKADMTLSFADVAAGTFEYERSQELAQVGYERTLALIPALRSALEASSG
jgi:NTE family protein